MMAHLTFFCFSKILPSIPVVVHILIPYRLLLLHSQSLSHSFIYFIPRHSPFTCQWTFIVLLPANGHSSFYMLPAYSGMIRSPFACPSTSDGHDVPSLSVGQPGILLFVSVTKLFLFRLPHR